MANLNIEIDTTELNELQVRLMKRVVSTLEYVMHTDEESEYFESSAELLRLVAETIKFSHFTTQDKALDHAEQALQYSVDKLADQIYENTLVKHDC